MEMEMGNGERGHPMIKLAITYQSHINNVIINFVEPFIPYAVRLVATICDLTIPVFNGTAYTQEGKLSCSS
jgi:hypothetical protein